LIFCTTVYFVNLDDEFAPLVAYRWVTDVCGCGGDIMNVVSSRECTSKEEKQIPCLDVHEPYYSKENPVCT
jgi:hypothetical protein